MNFRKLACILFCILLFSSCNILFDVKEATAFVECKKSNCFDVNVKGSVMDQSTSSVLQNIPVTLTWENSNSVLETDNIIDVQYCTTAGNYNFVNSIDTTFFQNGYHLKLSVPALTNYITYPKSGSFNIFIPDSAKNMNNLNYEFYPKTQLVIKLVREKTDAMESIVVSHFFRKNMGYSDKTITRTGSTYDSSLTTDLNVETAADRKTYISWTKKLTNGSKSIKTDSIICKKNSVNIYKISY